jgi:hypothetical protein
MMTLRGRVTSGGKKGTRNTRRDAEKLRDALGASVVDGTLNVLLKRPVMFANDTAIRIPVDDGGPPRLEWRARLNGVEVWINRRSKPLHTAGLLSAVHLRTRLHLSDGDEVQLEVRRRDVAPIPLVGWLTWNLFWLGRENWFYSRADYMARAQRWCMRFGATQLVTRETCAGLSAALCKTVMRNLAARAVTSSDPARRNGR